LQQSLISENLFIFVAYNLSQIGPILLITGVELATAPLARVEPSSYRLTAPVNGV